MQLHLPTLFVTIIVVSATLAASMAWMAYGRDRSLMLWAAALGLHTVAFGLISLRGQLGDFASIVLANVALSATVALFAEGVFRFQRRHAPRVRIWLPVAVIAISFPLLLADLQTRVTVSALALAFQSLTLLTALLQRHQETIGRGQYLLAAGTALAFVVLVARAAAAASGQMHMSTLVSAHPVQSATFMTAIASLILVTLGWVIMAKDAAQGGELFAQGILDSMPHQIAVIDKAGTIVAINKAWRSFSMDNSGQPSQMAPRTDVGVNYLGCCGTTIAAAEMTEAAQGIRAVLEGRMLGFRLEYPCHAPHEQRWFMMDVTPLSPPGSGAVVVHSNITDRKRTEDQVRNLAYYDTLTQLPNRRMLQDRLTQALASSKRSGLQGALMLLDLDNFKPLNDQHGHAAGDLLLIEVAHRLSANVREMDTVARLGGDEFVVLLGALQANAGASRTQAMVVAEKLRVALAQPYILTQTHEAPQSSVIEHHCTASVGITLFTGQDTLQNDIIKRADTAMYRAKEAGRNTICFHESAG